MLPNNIGCFPIVRDPLQLSVSLYHWMAKNNLSNADVPLNTNKPIQLIITTLLYSTIIQARQATFVILQKIYLSPILCRAGLRAMWPRA